MIPITVAADNLAAALNAFTAALAGLPRPALPPDPLLARLAAVENGWEFAFGRARVSAFQAFSLPANHPLTAAFTAARPAGSRDASALGSLIARLSRLPGSRLYMVRTARGNVWGLDDRKT